MRPSALAITSLFVACIVCPAAAEVTNLLALQEGTLPVVEPSTYSWNWNSLMLIDDDPGSGWAAESGKLGNHVFVFEIANVPATLERFELDTAGIDGDGRGARRVVIEVSSTGRDKGFVEVARGELADRADRQKLAAAKKVAGRWVRLTLDGNHGDAEWIELMSFRGYGERPPAAAPLAASGTYETEYGLFHVRQQGAALSGCYEHDGGLLEGTIDGRVMKLSWHEDGGPDDRGPAVMVFAPAGESFLGYWWNGSDKGSRPAGSWDGKRVGSAVGSCPHWSGSVGGELKKGLSTSGRVQLHGILFDLDSAKLRSESGPVLDEVVRLLVAEPAWKLTIEGHTDATGAPAHNQTLSEQRAEAVKSYLVSHGVETARLATAGFGATRGVADNATELGRAQNRRVELVKR